MKYVQNYNLFKGSKTINEQYIEMPGFEVAADAMINEFKDWYKETADGWEEEWAETMDEDSIDEAAKNAQMQILAYLSNEMNKVISDRKYRVRADFK